MTSPPNDPTPRLPQFVVAASRASEQARVDAHFANVLGVLRATQPRSLSRQQQRARRSHIERLDGYRRRRLFPKNERFPGRRLPHFIDAHGTRCAMAHLIELSGGRDLVRHIAGVRNFARIRQLADFPELVAWLEENGLTLEEAALIQPEYCGPLAQNCLCGNGIGRGFVAGYVGEGGSELIVTAVYGPITQVKPGDVLPVQDNTNVGLQHDVLFTSLGGDARTVFVEFGASNGEVSIPTRACWFPQVAHIPGSLPLALVTKALSQPDEKSCEKILTDHDQAWGQQPAGCGNETGTGGASGAGGASGGAGASGAGGASNDAGDVGGPAHDAGVRHASGKDGGCSFSGRAAPSSAIGLVVTAAWLAQQRRRSRAQR